jgi:hypothetical protein
MRTPSFARHAPAGQALRGASVGAVLRAVRAPANTPVFSLALAPAYPVAAAVSSPSLGDQAAARAFAPGLRARGAFQLLPLAKPASAGGFAVAGCAGRVQLKGEVVRLVHALSFAARQWGTKWGSRLHFFIEPPMQQTTLPLLCRLDGPSVAPSEFVRRCRSYREAVRFAFALRRATNMTQRMLAAEADLRPQLISDYLNADDKPQRKSLPAERIAMFEAAVGNTLVSQWVAWQSKLTVLEQLQAERLAA